MGRPKLPPEKKPVRKTISISKLALRNAESKAKRRGFEHSFSAYVAWLIQRDTEGGVVREDG